MGLSEEFQFPFHPADFVVYFGMWTLIASFFWGTVGFAFFLYGKKANEMAALGVGVVLMALSYFLSAIWLTVVSVALIGGFWYYLKRY